MTQIKIQYFASDLSIALGIGKIQEMHVDQVNGQRVLRITCEEAVKDEYHTVKPRTEKRAVKKPKHDTDGDTRAASSGVKGILQQANSNLNPFSEKNWSNKKKPDFMR